MRSSKSPYGLYESKHTWYGKNWFQSKLEAQWAVFFDQLGLTWRYEPKTFEFNGEKYTPDFLIKDWCCYVEIKFRRKDLKAWSASNLRKLGKLKPACAVLLIVGRPALEEYEVRYFKRNDELNGTSGWAFGEGRKNKHAEYLAQEHRKPIYLTGHGNRNAPRPTARPLFRRGEIKRFRNAYDNAVNGPPLIRNGRFIICDHDCPYCDDMATSPKHR
jgi:hypothetical protein